ncbi:hypothetical protein GBAR_LOCUS28883 [Geodia barretti]|uniref:Uncharacterized protein n=1 Tax=Geodia barretti TaxID=519541 RepID=A0AA35TQU9_GEOBA|nr:hypothetical protein GBAR_LOCUS28883 [Geodia barretti]
MTMVGGDCQSDVLLCQCLNNLAKLLYSNGAADEWTSFSGLSPSLRRLSSYTNLHQQRPGHWCRSSLGGELPAGLHSHHEGRQPQRLFRCLQRRPRPKARSECSLSRCGQCYHKLALVRELHSLLIPHSCCGSTSPLSPDPLPPNTLPHPPCAPGAMKLWHWPYIIPLTGTVVGPLGVCHSGCVYTGATESHHAVR